MESTELILICASAFAGVFFILSLLALLMRLITRFFPHMESAADQTVTAAISTAAHQAYPGFMVTKIEELR